MAWRPEYAADETRLAIVRATIERTDFCGLHKLSLEEVIRASVELDLIVLNDDPRQQMLGAALAREEEDRRCADRSIVPTARDLRKTMCRIYETA